MRWLCYLVVRQFYTTCLNILFVGIRLGWTLKTLNLLGWIPTVRHRFMGVKPNIFHSILIFMLNIWGMDSKYRITEIQQLSLRPSSGPKCPPLKNGHLGPRSVGPPDRWAPDRCRSPTSDMIFVKYFTHIRQI